jgi:anti-sigma B factor antagonist
MRSTTQRTWLEIEQLGEATVAKFTTRHILDSEKLHSLGDQLVKLGEQVGRQPLILEFGRVERFSSEMLGKLLALHRKVEARSGKLILCGLTADLRQIFRVMHLEPLFNFCANEPEALQELQNLT